MARNNERKATLTCLPTVVRRTKVGKSGKGCTSNDTGYAVRFESV